MPRRSDDYHGGGSGWRFAWRDDRLHQLHELGRDFGMTEDANVPRAEERVTPAESPAPSEEETAALE